MKTITVMAILFKLSIFSLYIYMQLSGLKTGNTDNLTTTSNGEKPVANFEYSTFEASGEVTFTDLSTNNPNYWHWNFGDGLTSNKRNPVRRFYSNGKHTIQLIVKNEFGSDTVTMDIMVNLDYPQTKFSYTIVEGTGQVQFKDESTNGPFRWIWEFGDGETSYLQNPTHQYKKSGNYRVAFSSANPRGNTWTQATITVTVSAAEPIANFQYEQEGASGLVNFRDLSENEPTSWIWDFGDGNSSTQQNPIHQYQIPGNYDVQLIAENRYGVDAIKLPININFGNPPVTRFEYTLIEESLEVSFTDLSANEPTVWFWDFGDGNSSTVQNPRHQYQAPGNYLVQLVAGNTFGMSTYETNLNLPQLQKPKAKFDYEVIQESSMVVFSDQSQNDPTSWHWDFGDGNESMDQNPTHEYRHPGIFVIGLTVENQFGKDSTTKSISIGPPPIALFEYDVIQESGLVKFSDQSQNDPTSWQWNFGDGNSSNLQHPTYQYQQSGNYTISLVAGNQFGRDTIKLSTQITIGNPPNAKFTFVVLEGKGLVNFEDQSDHEPTEWFWDFGDGNSSTLQHPTHQYQNEGTYNILFLPKNKYGIDSISQSLIIQIGQPPKAKFDYSLVGESGEIAFNDQSDHEPKVWIWDFGDGNSSREQNPAHVYQNSGNYIVTLTVSNQFGTDLSTRELAIIVGKSPRAKFTFTIDDVSGQANFLDRSENQPSNWLWDFGDGHTSAQQNPAHRYQNSGNYTVQLIASNKFGQDVATQTIAYSAVSPPNAKFEFAFTEEAGQVNFTDRSENQPTNWLWDFGDGNTSAQQNPSHRYQNSGNYTVQLIAANKAGISTTQSEIDLTITQTENLHNGEGLLIYPNPFKDNLIFNILHLYQEDLNLRIYTISGQLIYETILSHKIEVDTHGWAKGAYIFQLSKQQRIIASGKLLK